MSMFRLAAAIVVSIGIVAAPAMAQEEMLGIPGPITFEGTDFELAWTSHPTPAYYKQEYVPAGQAVDSYIQMFMVDVLTEGQTPQSASASMIMGLEDRKAQGDPVVNYDIVKNDETGELILDFLISDSSSGNIIVEWNAFRYSPTADGDGLTLFAISRRGYGEEGATQFLEALTSWRATSIQQLAIMDLPAVTITD